MRRSARITSLVLAAILGLTPAIASAETAINMDQNDVWRPPHPGGARPGPGPRPGYVRPAPPPVYHRAPPPVYHRAPPPHWRDRDDDGGAVAAGILGLAIGAIAAGAASRGAVVYDDDHVERCLRRYRSYDPSSDTYRGNDGRLHRCRL
ncbi:MAG: BA14K family protein [Hyphomicrobiales bacterium]|nr:BA14K family protein [Hyphomicrobiales bacterium]